MQAQAMHRLTTLDPTRGEDEELLRDLGLKPMLV
jgi:hypothetical protein